MAKIKAPIPKIVESEIKILEKLARSCQGVFEEEKIAEKAKNTAP